MSRPEDGRRQGPEGREGLEAHLLAVVQRGIRYSEERGWPGTAGRLAAEIGDVPTTLEGIRVAKANCANNFAGETATILLRQISLRNGQESLKRQLVAVAQEGITYYQRHDDPGAAGKLAARLFNQTDNPNLRRELRNMVHLGFRDHQKKGNDDYAGDLASTMLWQMRPEIKQTCLGSKLKVELPYAAKGGMRYAQKRRNPLAGIIAARLLPHVERDEEEEDLLAVAREGIEVSRQKEEHPTAGIIAAMIGDKIIAQEEMESCRRKGFPDYEAEIAATLLQQMRRQRQAR